MIRELIVLSESVSGDRQMYPNKMSREHECEVLRVQRPKSKEEAIQNRIVTQLIYEYENDILPTYKKPLLELKERLTKLNL